MMETANVMTDVFGPVIFSYSRDQAIKDGVLVDLSSTFPSEAGLYKYPVACTSAVWDIVDKAVKNKKHMNDYSGVIWDVIYMSQKYIVKRFDSSSHLFKVIITGAGRKKNFVFKAVCGPGDDSEPVITIMLPDED